MIRAAIALGANLGDAPATVLAAFERLAALPQSRLVATSPRYRTAPVGYADQPDFINAAALIETALSPHELLRALLSIEQDCGRERSFRNAPRTLDLDLLVYGDQQLADDDLVLPHPRLGERAFVLGPLADIAPELVVPGLGRVDVLLAALPQAGRAGIVRLD